MNQGKICVSVCGTNVDAVLARMDRARDAGADVIEIRFDCVDRSEIDQLLAKLETRAEQLLITFRPIEQGGAREITRRERIEFWDKVASGLGKKHLVDIEYNIDFPVAIDKDGIIGSAHYFDGRRGDLIDEFEDLWKFPCGAVKLAVSVNDASDAVDVWKLLDHGRPAIAIAMGEAGKWTRILGLANGAFLTYASLEAADATAPGQISAEDLRNVFRVKDIDQRTHVYAVLAGDTTYSLSPYMHNAAFATVGLDSVFVPMQVGDLDAFIRRMVAGATRETELHFKGFSVTNPHKQSVMKFLDEIDPAARRIGAVNTIKIEHGKLHGFNTDAPGFIRPLTNIYGDLRGARASVVGAGGAARACVYALKEAGSDVTLLARDTAKAASMAEEFDVRIEQLTKGDRQLTTDILVNATPLGTTGDRQNESVAVSDELAGVKLVYDLVYNPAETKLIKEAKTAGVMTLGGLEMLVAQGTRQFEIWTGGEAPVDVMKAAVEERLNQTYAA
jgi:3-dehydroquinate dehydratase / shikimate dehydrogenase